MNILITIGTRPEAIKMAPVIHELQRQGVEFKVCVTAQHREMLDQVLDFFKIVPDFDLNLMRENQSLNLLSTGILTGMERVFSSYKPDLMLIHGDTTTSFMAAMAAFHNEIRIGHVEAGLRTFNLQSPFPEEMNRQLTGRLANVHFAPTKKAKENLLKENILPESIVVTGNTVVDALLLAEKRINEISPYVISEITGLRPESLQDFILVTGHRRENFGKGLKEICSALLELSNQINIIFPVHLNPNVWKEVNRLLQEKDNIHLIDPVSYPIMLWLMKHSKFIISDSGGIQEEAPSFGKKVLVTRELSERMEGIEANVAVLVGSNAKRIVAESDKILLAPFDTPAMNPYGDGHASKRIVDFIKENVD